MKELDDDTKTKPILPPPIHNNAPKGESKLSKRINKIVIAALIATTASLGLMFYWAATSNEPITLNQAPLPVRTIREHPTAGGVVFLRTDYCKTTNATGKLRISFISETQEIFLPMAQEISKKGCHNRELAILIPNDIRADTYRVKMRITYQLNPLKKNVTQRFISKEVIIDPTSADNTLPASTNLTPR